MKILLSAYACEPNRGSEPGVGWNWAIELAQLGHEVCVLTRANNRTSIEAALADSPLKERLHFAYYDLPKWAAWWKKGGKSVHLYYYLWQIGVLQLAQELHAARNFDAVQHLTFGSSRFPTLLWRLGAPLVLGPIGGGERAPMALRKHFGWKAWLKDWLRDLSNRVSLVDPLVRIAFHKASVILCKTSDTRKTLPSSVQHKAFDCLEIGLKSHQFQSRESATARNTPLRLLFVGRFIYWKGMGLGLRALAEAVARGQDVTLTMVGSGPDEQEWRHLATALKIADRVNWVAWIPQDQLNALYANHDALLFPSLHDSSGNAVLESLGQSLPVICLDIGGPAAVTGSEGAVIVPVSHADEALAVSGLFKAIADLNEDREMLRELSRAAYIRAFNMAWANVVERVWPAPDSTIKSVLEWCK